MAEIPLAVDLTQRSIGSRKDSYILNGYVETIGDRKYVRKRPGIDGDHPADSSKTSYNSDSHAIYCATQDRKVYYVHDNTTAKLMQWLNAGDTPTDLGSLGASIDFSTSTQVMMKEVTTDDNGAIGLFVKGASRFAVYDFSSTITTGTGGGYPSDTGPGLAHVDGYTFVHDGTSIFNCNLNDPTTWTATDYIVPTRMADQIVHLTDYKQHVVAFSKGSIEFFYNASNPSGSPLKSRSDLVYRIGVPTSSDSFPAVWQDQNADYIVFMAYENGRRYVAEIVDFQIRKVSNRAIDAIINSADLDGSDTTLAGFSVRGKRFVALTVWYVAPGGASTSEWVYIWDRDEQLWYEWAAGALSTVVSMVQSCPIISSSAGGPLTTAVTNYQGNIYVFDPGAYADVIPASGLNYKFEIQTQRLYGDSTFMSDFKLFGDRDIQTTFDVQWTDDDYQTYNTAVSLNFSNPRAKIASLGRFEDRAFRIGFTGNADARLTHATAVVE